jgi:hypothetical protein
MSQIVRALRMEDSVSYSGEGSAPAKTETRTFWLLPIFLVTVGL